MLTISEFEQLVEHAKADLSKTADVDMSERDVDAGWSRVGDDGSDGHRPQVHGDARLAQRHDSAPSRPPAAKLGCAPALAGSRGSAKLQAHPLRPSLNRGLGALAAALHTDGSKHGVPIPVDDNTIEDSGRDVKMLPALHDRQGLRFREFRDGFSAL